MAAILEGKGKHGLRRRALLNFVRPVSALAISGGRRTYVQQILEHPRVRAHARGRDLIVKRILAGNEDTTVMLAGGASSPACEVVLRAAHRPRAAQRVRHNAAVLQSLAELQLPFEVPALLASGEYAEGAFISAESCLPGTVLLSVQAGSAKNSYMRTAVEKWTLFRRDHASEVAIADGDYERLIGSAFAKMRRFTSDADATRIDQLSGALKHALCSRKWSLGPMHGDFKVGNILVDGRGDVCGVIDWDCWEPRGLPLIDAMTLCVYEDARDSKRHFGDSITRGLFRGEWSGFHQDVIATSALQYELSPRDLDTLKVAFWVINLRDRIHWLALSTEREAELYLSAPLRDALELIG
jgi:Ser/Thr protein kinase RdoA (MazF antagonist)